MSLKLTEDDVQNCTWTLVESTPEYRRYTGRGTHPKTGVPITVQKTEYLAEAKLLQWNEEQRNNTDGTRWTQGAGSDRNGLGLVKVASVPMNVFMSEFASRLREGDHDFSRWWLNSEKAAPFRTRRGKV